MKNVLVWKTSAGRFANLISLSHKGKRKIILTTVKDFQRGGRLEFFWKNEEKIRSGGSIKISDLPPNKPGDPVLTINCAFNGRDKVKIGYRTDKNKRLTRSLIVPQDFQPERKHRSFLNPGILMVIIFGIFITLMIIISPWVGKSEKSTQQLPSNNRTANTLPAVNQQETEETTHIERIKEQPEPTVTRDAISERTPEPSAKDETNSPVITMDTLNKSIYFQPESYELTEKAIAELEILSISLKGQDLSRLRITGHCALFGTEEERVELSLKRAENTADYLRSRMDIPESTPIRGFGGSAPASMDKDKQDRNRRVEIELNP
ncbi:MAG: OmpA family protein [Spirochaetales bacterium]|nr:OmpA family protein [Spirochaetales bacterium]